MCTSLRQWHSSPAAEALHCQPSGIVMPLQWHSSLTATAMQCHGSGRTSPLPWHCIVSEKRVSFYFVIGLYFGTSIFISAQAMR